MARFTFVVIFVSAVVVLDRDVQPPGPLEKPASTGSP
jgi:hypothetical protein